MTEHSKLYLGLFTSLLLIVCHSLGGALDYAVTADNFVEIKGEISVASIRAKTPPNQLIDMLLLCDNVKQETLLEDDGRIKLYKVTYDAFYYNQDDIKEDTQLNYSGFFRKLEPSIQELFFENQKDNKAEVTLYYNKNHPVNVLVKVKDGSIQDFSCFLSDYEHDEEMFK